MLDDDKETYLMSSRTDDVIEIQIERAPIGESLKVFIEQQPLDATPLDSNIVPVALALNSTSSDDLDGSTAFVPIATEVDVANRRISASLSAEHFSQRSSGVYVASIRLAMLRGEPQAVNSSSLITNPAAPNFGASVKAAGAMGGPIDCPLLRPDGCIERSMFGPRVKANGDTVNHRGIDLRGSEADNVYGVPNTRVTFVRTPEEASDPLLPESSRRAGASVWLQNGTVTYRYLHLSQTFVKVGDRLTGSGTANLIGRAGETGSPGNPHLHFEIHAPSVRAVLGTRILYVVGPVDPFPALVDRFVATPPPPSALPVGSSLSLRLQAMDRNGRLIGSQIDTSTFPKGTKRHLCLSEQAGLFTSNQSFSLTSTSSDANTRCLIWDQGTSAPAFLLTAGRTGTTTLSVSYLDSRLERTPVPSLPFFTAGVSVEPRRAALTMTPGLSCGPRTSQGRDRFGIEHFATACFMNVSIAVDCGGVCDSSHRGQLVGQVDYSGRGQACSPPSTSPYASGSLSETISGQTRDSQGNVTGFNLLIETGYLVLRIDPPYEEPSCSESRNVLRVQYRAGPSDRPTFPETFTLSYQVP